MHWNWGKSATCEIASWSSLQEATMEFLARSISSNEAPSDTPNSFSAFSTDISNGAESSAREPAWTGPTLLVDACLHLLWSGAVRQGLVEIGLTSRWTGGGREKGEPEEIRSDRTGIGDVVADICVLKKCEAWSVCFY